MFTTFTKVVIKTCLFELHHVNVPTLNTHIFILVSELKETPFTFIYGKETAAITETTRIFPKTVCSLPLKPSPLCPAWLTPVLSTTKAED